MNNHYVTDSYRIMRIDSAWIISSNAHDIIVPLIQFIKCLCVDMQITLHFMLVAHAWWDQSNVVIIRCQEGVLPPGNVNKTQSPWRPCMIISNIPLLCLFCNNWCKRLRLPITLILNYHNLTKSISCEVMQDYTFKQKWTPIRENTIQSQILLTNLCQFIYVLASYTMCSTEPEDIVYVVSKCDLLLIQV